jgi:hypothetical protein
MTGLTIGDKLEAEWREARHGVASWFDHEQQWAQQPTFTPHDQLPAPSEPPVPSQQDQPSPPAQPEPTQEEPMSVLSDELNALAARLAPIDDDAVTKLEQVKADPDKSRAFDAVAALPSPLTPIASAMVAALEALAQQPQ